VQDTCTAGPAEVHSSGSSRVYFLRPRDGQVNVIFPIQFFGTQDAAVGKTFLQVRCIAAEHRAVLQVAFNMHVVPSCHSVM
jgi:hypothetical protein